MSSFLHGVLLLLAIVLLPFVINRIPLAALAAILLHVGYKLTNINIYRAIFKQETGQWVPFIVTVVVIVATDLLTGVGVGMVVGVFFILRANIKTPYFIHHREAHEEDHRQHIKLELSENVSFLNKASVNKVLHEMPSDSMVEIDGTSAQYIHPDVLELIHEFNDTAATRGIEVRLTNVGAAPESAGGH
jgi:MFS superfamily sulfate permease-like transporter